MAEDAASLVTLDYEPLPAVVDPRAGLEPGAPKARSECADNLVAHWTVQYGEVESAFAGAAHRISEAFSHPQRRRPFDRAARRGGPLRRRRGAADGLGFHPDAAQDQARSGPGARAGGEPGAGDRARGRRRLWARRIRFYPEELAVPAAALLLRWPIKWIEDRREASPPRTMSGCRIGRSRPPSARAESCSRSAGIFVTTTAPSRRRGFRCRKTRTTNLLGPYVLPAYQLEVSCCLTNMVAATSTRGAGRPQGTYRDGAAARSHRRRTRSGARRGPPPQPDRARADALRHAGQDPRRTADDLRQRRLPRMPAPHSRSRRLGGFSGAPRGGAARRPSTSASGLRTMSKAPAAARSKAPPSAWDHPAK